MSCSPNPSAPPESWPVDSRNAANGTPRWRAAAGCVLIACLAALGLGASMTPAAEGLGTHRQLGLPACRWHTQRGWECPTCGVTTAFTLTTHGRLIDGARTQPFGAALAWIIALTAWISGHAMITGCPAARRLSCLAGPRTALALAVLLAGSWVYRLWWA